MLVETLVTQCSPCYSAVSSSLMNPLPDCSNYSPFCHTHYLTPDQYFTSLFGLDFYQAAPLKTNTSLLQRFTADLVGNSGETQCLEEAEQRAEASFDVPYPLQIVNSVPFSLYLYPLSAPFLNPLSSPSPPSLLSLLIYPLSIKTSSFITFCFNNGTYFCILLHTMTYYFNNAFYKLVKTTL